MSNAENPEILIRLLKESFPENQESVMDYLIRITAPDIREKADRIILNLGLVLDRSGSMSGRKLQKVKEAATYCLGNLLKTDIFSLTVFDDEVQVLVPSGPPADRSRIKALIDGITTGGSTALHAAGCPEQHRSPGFSTPDSLTE